jgi:dephospho-CoA kinase
VIGITGGVGTGKSTFARYLRELLPGAQFFDADEMARKLTQEDAVVLRDIRAKFGADVFESNGELNRRALRAIVFGAPEKRRALEEILHPPIRRHWSGEAAKSGDALFFADIPLLYETGGEQLCQSVLVVACSETVQIERLMNRTGLDAHSARAIMAAQMPLEEKTRRAEHVVWNDGMQSVLREQARLMSKRKTVRHWSPSRTCRDRTAQQRRRFR